MEIKIGLIDFLLIAPALALFLVSCIPLGIKVVRGNREQNTFATLTYALMGVVIGLGFTISTMGVSRTAFSEALVFDGISHFTSIVVLVLTGIALTYLRDGAATAMNLFTENVFLVMNASVGMLTMIWSNDLIITFVGLELFSLALYMLIALSREGRASKEAAFKYFVLGSFGSAIMLYGISFIYGTVGSTYLPEVQAATVSLIGTNRLFVIGFIMLLIGIFFKISIFPFHAWTPDVYQGSPTALTAYMSTAVQAVSLAFLLRLTASQAFTVERFWPFVDVLQWLAALTILIGNVGAFRQKSLKRMLAYSSVAHSGYVMMGIIAAGIGSASMLGASGVMFYVLAYSVMTIGAFGVISLLESKPESDLTVDDLKGMAYSKPWLALCLTLLLLSLMGIPPTIGFFGKFFLFSAAVKQGLIWLAIWGVIGSIISVYYYLRPVLAMYMQERELPAEAVPMRSMSYFTVLTLGFLVVILGVFAEPIYRLVFSSLTQVL
jgi:NADH-quinone oxidoreductase subunit N